MADKTRDPGAADRPADEADVEGHNMWIGPTVARDLARNRSRDLDKQVRDQKRVRETKRR